MERKFMVYQRRDGFQIAEEATGTRLENGMEFLARPHKSALWCTAEFNIVIDDDYELVGEEFVNCSRLPTRVLCFVDGVMKIFDQSRIAIENMIEEFNDAISDRDLIVARQLKADINAAIEQCHADALETNTFIDYATKNRAFRAYWLKSKSGNSATDVEAWDAMHAEAMAINAEMNSNQQHQKLVASDIWQTRGRGSNDQEYQIYRSCADDGKGNEFMTGKPLKTYEQWLRS